LEALLIERETENGRVSER